MKIVAFQSVPTARERYVVQAFAAGCGAIVREAEAGYVPCDIAVTYGMVKWRWDVEPYPRSRARLHVRGDGATTTTVDGVRAVLARIGAGEVMPGASAWKAALFQAHRGLWIILERGFHRRDLYWSAGIGGINGRADFGLVPPFAAERTGRLGFCAAPWLERRSREEDYVLVAGQVPWDVSVQDTDHIDWCRRTVLDLRQMGFDVRFRPHPLARGIDYGVEAVVDCRDLGAVLAGARAVVTWSSNLGVDAALAGVPVIAMDAGSMARSVAGHRLSDLSHRHRPWRGDWLLRLAHAQWTVEEMADGLAWSQLAPALERQAA